ncbi:hypothetical protein [Streptomyces sp.]|uniref:hypothetical protein n=1 Tax=Streptomyces sp. TaxID=1931 RepID=UPI002F4288C0
MTTTPEQRHAGESPEPAERTDQTATTSAGSPPAETHDALTATSLPPRELPRWVRWTVVPLLILVPLGYVIISAQQSRVSGEDKQQEAAAKHLKWRVPSQLRRHIYQVPIPDGTVDDGYLETNSWDTSRLYVQFTTSAGGLDTFLAQVGTSRSALVAGEDAIAPAQARTVGWSFPADRPWSGVSLHQVGDKPDHDIIVDLKNPDVPTVYVVSTINFQHRFGGG